MVGLVGGVVGAAGAWVGVEGEWWERGCYKKLLLWVLLLWVLLITATAGRRSNQCAMLQLWADGCV